MPNDVIDRVHHMARQQRANRGLIFVEQHQNTSIDTYWDDSDDSDDESYHPADNQPEDDNDNYSDDDDDDDGDGDDQAPENHLPVHHAGNVQHEDDDDHSWQPDDDHNNNDDISSVVDSSTVGSDGDQNNEVEEDIVEDGLNDEGPAYHDVAAEGPENQGVAAEGLENQGVAAEGSENQGVEDRNEVEGQELLEQRMDEQHGVRSGRYGLRPCRMPKYAGVPRAHLHATVTKSSTIQPSGGGETWAMAQVMMDKGLKMFGSDGLASVKSEMKQLHDRKVMQPRFKKDLTSQQRAEALSYLMFLKHK